MTLKTKLVLRLLWIAFGFLAVVGGIYMTVCGFGGTLAPFFAGMGWLIATLNIFTSVLCDVGKTVQTVIDPAGEDK